MISATEEVRKNFLKEFDKYIRENVKDERILDTWNAMGIPFYAEEEDFNYIAKNEQEFVTICTLFGKLCGK
jgi:hypothetical protein